MQDTVPPPNWASRPVRALTGDEDVVWFTIKQAFTGVTQDWLRARLRLDPAQEYLDLEGEGPSVELDGETVEDLDLDVILGTGPNDGQLIAVEGPGDSGASAYVRGGWLESIAPDISRDVTWIGPDADLQAVAKGCVITWLAMWEDIWLTYDRTGAFNDM